MVHVLWQSQFPYHEAPWTPTPLLLTAILFTEEPT